MFSTWEFPDAERLRPYAQTIAPRIAALQRRCERAGVPIVFVNDDDGPWRSDSSALLERCAGSPGGAGIAALLTPSPLASIVLKARHSAFYATPLDLVLRQLGAQRLILTGVATDQCILLTAVEARMRDYAVAVPADCVAAQSPARHRTALHQLKEAHRIGIGDSQTLRFDHA